MYNQIHFASQYLAAAGISFLEHKADDSHTNVGFNTDTQSFETRELNDNNLKLSFDLPNFQLLWSTGESMALDGKNHAQVVQWLQSSSNLVALDKPYVFDLHYELPFDWDDTFSFELSDMTLIRELIELRKLANNALHSFLEAHHLSSEIRIWPHHFDTGAFVVLEDGSDKSVGMGLAIPDSMVNDHYFYMSGYLGHDALDTSEFGSLSLGEWKNDGFKGAVLPTKAIEQSQAVQFLTEAYTQYIK